MPDDSNLFHHIEYFLNQPLPTDLAVSADYYYYAGILDLCLKFSRLNRYGVSVIWDQQLVSLQTLLSNSSHSSKLKLEQKKEYRSS